MANITKQKRDKMIAYLETLKEMHKDDESIRALNEIENSLRDKKFGLVFEEHTEEVEELMEDYIPVLTADPERRLCKDEELPWNFLIEGDNLQALYLLEKTHKGKVDCIYIDPPYNTGATDWKYNNDYVVKEDDYRHSKWLSMMQARLRIAKRLLSRTGVMIVAIDDYEYHHLFTLLEELFPSYSLSPVVVNHHPQGGSEDNISRTHEYAIFVIPPEVKKALYGKVIPVEVESWPLARSGKDIRNHRSGRPNQFYALYVDKEQHKVMDVGPKMSLDDPVDYTPTPEGYIPFYPISKKDGSHRVWRYERSTMKEKIDNGLITCSKTFSFKVNVVRENSEKNEAIFSNWTDSRYNAGTNGTDLISNIFNGESTFSYPKSLYTVFDAIYYATQKNKNAIVVDFFAGSGTTLNAVNLLNAQDNGHRTCILVTNNEDFSSEEGNPENGVARSVTWKRAKYTINGKRDDGSIIGGEYLTNIIEEKVKKRNNYQVSFASDDFLGNVNKMKQFVALLGKGKMAQSKVKSDSKFLVEKDYTAAILFDVNFVDDFIDALNDAGEIKEVYIFTTVKSTFKEISERIDDELSPNTVISYKTRPISDGFNENIKYFKCEWIQRRPEEYLLSNVLCLHVKEMIELQNHIELDNKKYVLILNKEDFEKYIHNNPDKDSIKGLWVNQNIMFNMAEMKELKKIGFKYIPKEFFGQELKEVAE